MLEKIISRSSIVLLALLPFHAIVVTFLNYGLNLQQFKILSLSLSSWKEILIVLIGILTVCHSCPISKYGVNSDRNLNFLNKKIPVFTGMTIGGFAFLAFLSYCYAKPAFGISQWVWGFRYDFFFLITFLIFSLNTFNKKEIYKLINIALFSSAIAILLGLIIFVIRPENLILIGFRNDWSTWYPNQALAFCQKIENSDFCRLSGTFAGPNQYGAYLIVVLPLIIWKFLEKKSKFWFSIGFLALISLVLTFSRSAWIAFVTEILILLIIYIYKKYEFKINLKKFFTIFLSIIIIFLLILFPLVKFTKFQNSILKPESTSQHFELMQNAIRIIKENSFGIGLGMAGPASYRFENENNKAIITENWYLQLAVELGIIGMILFMIILGQIIFQNLKNSLKQKKYLNENLFIALSLIGLATASIFLHNFEDSSTVLTLFTLLGILNSPPCPRSLEREGVKKVPLFEERDLG